MVKGRGLQRGCRGAGSTRDYQGAEEPLHRLHDFEAEEVNAFFEEHDDEIRDEIRERDDSTTVNDLIKNTRDIPVRVEMLSNYDCINSCWLESQGGFRYKESYWGYDRYSLNPCKEED